MELIFKFDPENKTERVFVRALGAALQVAVDKSEVQSEDESNEPEPEQVPEPTPTEEPQTKKRTRTKKESTAAAEEKATTDTGSDLPFDEAEPVQVASTEAPKEAVAFPRMTKDEWTDINHKKREELGLTVGGKNSGLIRDFNVYCQKNSELAFGNPKPSTLSEEELWQFAQWFQTIEMNPEYVPGASNENGVPFVSAALSKTE